MQAGGHGVPLLLSPASADVPVGSDMPTAAADLALGMFRAARSGEFAITDPALTRDEIQAVQALGFPARGVSVAALIRTVDSHPLAGSAAATGGRRLGA